MQVSWAGLGFGPSPANNGPRLSKTKSVFVGGLLNLSNTAMGGGIAVVALPLAMQEVGPWTVGIFVIGSGILSSFTCSLLVKASALTGRSSYFELAETLGHWKHAVTVTVLLNNFGVCVSFLDELGDVVPDIASTLAPGSILAQRKPCIGIMTSLLLLPMLGVRSMESFKVMSAFSLALLVFFLAVVLAVFCNIPPGQLPPPPPVVDPTNNFRHFRTSMEALAIVTLAYICHFNVLPICNGLERAADMHAIIKGAMALSSALYLAFGTLGFLVHPDTYGDMLFDFGGDSAMMAGARVSLVQLGRAGVAVSMALTFPLIAQEGVRCLSLCLDLAGGKICPRRCQRRRQRYARETERQRRRGGRGGGGDCTASCASDWPLLRPVPPPPPLPESSEPLRRDVRSDISGSNGDSMVDRADVMLLSPAASGGGGGGGGGRSPAGGGG
jgi:sodium-coupled neutral amino acid transporter 2